MKIKTLTVLFFILIFIKSSGGYAQNLFGKFSGGKVSIKGESTFFGHTDEIDLINYQLEIQKNGRGIENKICLFTKYADAASTTIIQAMQTNDLKTLTVENLQNSKAAMKTLGIVLEFDKVQIVNIRQWYDEVKQKIMEEVKISYNKLKMSYMPKNQIVEISIGVTN